MFYSQAGEDKYLYEKYFSKLIISEPVYFEAGALDGIKYSNTKFYEESLGWGGILVEPHPILYSELIKNRSDSKNFNYNCLLGSSAKPLKYLYYDHINLAAVSGVEATMPKANLDRFYESQDPWMQKMTKEFLRVKEMIPIPLAEVIKQSKVDHIDFFTLDVEGHELPVLQSFDWSVNINFMLIESLGSKAGNLEVESLLRVNGFKFLESVAHNSLFVREQFYYSSPIFL